MKTFVCLFALIGVACALSPNLQYEYEVIGKIATGIPGIRPLVAATGIKADMTVQMTNRRHAIVKLSKIEVGEYHGDSECVNLRQSLKIKFQPIEEINHEFGQNLVKPFAVDFSNEQGQVMVVPTRENEAITNIRKSMVQALNTVPIKVQAGEANPLTKSYESLSQFPTAFNLEEETIHGRCVSEYTITPLKGSLKEKAKREVEQKLESDAQRTESSVQQLAEKYYKMVRSIDFNKCHDRVILQFTGVGNASQVGNSQFEGIQSRSSVYSYILKGDKQNIRVERATVEGTVIFNPLYVQTEKLQAITNQTLVLKSVKQIQSQLRLSSSTRPVKTWRYEVASPHSPPSGTPKPWVNYRPNSDKYTPISSQFSLLGMPYTQSQTQDWKKTIIQYLTQVTDSIYTPSHVISSSSIFKQNIQSESTFKLYQASRLLGDLPLKDVQEIFNEVFEFNSGKATVLQNLLVDAAAASGAVAPARILLQKMQSGQISKARQVLFFSSLVNHLRTPVFIKECLEFSMSRDFKSEPYVKSAALINCAKAARRACLTPNNYTMPFPLFGREICDSRLIIEKFIPYLKQQLSTVSESYERAILVQTLSSLGSAHVIDLLRKAAFGQFDQSQQVRAIAIYGLGKENQDQYTRNEALDTLMTIIDNYSEPQYLRQAAIVSALTWHPSSSWYQRMAVSTYREPSRSVAAFIVSSFESIAKSTAPKLKQQSEYAAFALRKSKPMSPSIKYSYNKFTSIYDSQSQLRSNFQLGWLNSNKSSEQQELFTLLSASLSGDYYNIAKMAFASKGLKKQFAQLVTLLSQEGKGQQMGRPYRYQQMQKQQYGQNKPEMSLFLEGLGEMTQYIPINSELISKIAGPDFSMLLSELQHGRTFNFTRYANIQEKEFFLPTEIGFPLRGRLSRPLMIVSDAHVKLYTDRQSSQLNLRELMQARKFDVLAKVNQQVTLKTMGKLRVMVPYFEKIFETGVDNVHAVTLPYYLNMTVQRGLVADVPLNVTFNVSPATKQEFTIKYSHNVPYTSVTPFSPSQKPDVKIVTVQKKEKPLIQETQKAQSEFWGFSGYSTYKADVQKSAPLQSFFAYLRNPSKILLNVMGSQTAKLWQSSIVYKPSKSPVQNISLSVSLMRPASSVPQGSQKQVLEFSPYDTPQIRSQKLQQWTKPIAVSVQMVMNGTRNQQYRRMEVVAAWQEAQEDNYLQQQRKVQVSLLSTPIQGYTNSPKSICLSTESKSPKLESSQQLLQAFMQEMKQTLTGKLVYGESCKENEALAQFRGKLQLSKTRSEILFKELRHTHNVDQLDPLVGMRVAGIYDQGDLEVDYKQNIPKALRNATYILDGVIRDAVWPYGTFNHMNVQNAPNKISIKAERPLSSDSFTFYIQKPSENSIITNIQLPYQASRLVPFGGLTKPYWQQLKEMASSGEEESSSGEEESSPEQYQPNSEEDQRQSSSQDTCFIYDNKVSTMDHITYSYEPENCYTIASREEIHAEFEIRTRKNSRISGFSAQVLVSAESLNVEFDQEQALLNGVKIQFPSGENSYDVKGESGRIIMTVRRNPAYINVELLERMNVTTYPTVVQITPLTRVNTMKLRGICGDFNGQSAYEFTGPRECLYTNSTLYRLSWTIPKGDDCNTQELQYQEKYVHEYQSRCPPRPRQGNYESSKFIRVYPVITEHQQVCVTKSPVKRCQEGQVALKKQTVEKQVKCFSKNAQKSNSEVQRLQGSEFSRYPINYPSSFESTKSVVEHLACKAY